LNVQISQGNAVMDSKLGGRCNSSFIYGLSLNGVMKNH